MDIFAALADPTRRRIVEMLGAGELPAGALAERFAISAPAVSQHLKALKAAGLVQARIDGQRRIYRLRPDGFDELLQWLEMATRQWRQAPEPELPAEDGGEALREAAAGILRLVASAGR